MGLFDLPAPLFSVIDGALGIVLPPFARLVLWGIFAGWMTMVAYRKLSNQDKISALKKEQKEQQKVMAGFDGEMDELLPLIMGTLGLGFRQLGLAIGPALLATVPVLFLVAWVAGAFGYHAPLAGSMVALTATPAEAELDWQPRAAISRGDQRWELDWPAAAEKVSLMSSGEEILVLPTAAMVPVIHKKQWWNSLFGNPIGYLPDDGALEQLDIGLPGQQFLPFGPDWLQGWMFLFFTVFMLSSLGFKFLLKID